MTTAKTYGSKIEVTVDNGMVTFDAPTKIGQMLLSSAESVGMSVGAQGGLTAPKLTDHLEYPLSAVSVAKVKEPTLLTNGYVEVKLPEREAPLRLAYLKKHANEFAELAAALGA